MILNLLTAVAKTVDNSQNGQIDWSTLVTSALIAALISAFVTIIGQWVARQNAKLAATIAQQNAKLAADLEVATTLTKSRQEWINILREDMAHFAGLSARRSRAISAGQAFDADDFERMVAISARIQMRLNPRDPHFDALVSNISDCSLEKDASKHGKATGDFVRISQVILKEEWEVLKRELKELTAESFPSA